jgi:hypothetical protein
MLEAEPDHRRLAAGIAAPAPLPVAGVLAPVLVETGGRAWWQAFAAMVVSVSTALLLIYLQIKRRGGSLVIAE